jgi:hypothetical protein
MIRLPLILLAAAGVALGDIVTHNGQIFTPGFVVVNAPQPNTPLGGGKYENTFNKIIGDKSPMLIRRAPATRNTPPISRRNGQRRSTTPPTKGRQREPDIQHHHLPVQL